MSVQYDRRSREARSNAVVPILGTDVAPLMLHCEAIVQSYKHIDRCSCVARPVRAVAALEGCASGIADLLLSLSTPRQYLKHRILSRQIPSSNAR